MLKSPRFARVAYAMFGVAILLALLKLGSLSDAEPLVLRSVPAAPATEAEETAAGDDKAFVGDLLDLPETSPPSDSTRPDRTTFREKTPDVASSASGDAIFRRPSSGQPLAPVATKRRGFSPGLPAPGDGPVCGNLGDSPKSSRAVFPLPKGYFDSYDDTWGAARPQGGHEGSDLMSPTGTLEFAITDGTIVAARGSNKDGWNRLGGYTAMLRADYDMGPIREGDLFYYAHMDEKSAVEVGTKVRAGQQVGVVGDTGEGPEGTRGKFPPHLHLGWYTNPDSDRTKAASGAMDPYPLLLWLESHGGAVSGGTNAAYCELPQEPVPASEKDPTPGTGADLDTGDRDPRPVAEKYRDGEPEKGPTKKPDERDGAAQEERTATPDPKPAKSGTPGVEHPAAAPDKKRTVAGTGRGSGPSGKQDPPATKAAPAKEASEEARQSSSQPPRSVRPSYDAASLLTGALPKDEAGGREVEARDAGAQADEKRGKQKEEPNPSEATKPKKKDETLKTGVAKPSKQRQGKGKGKSDSPSSGPNPSRDAAGAAEPKADG